MNRWTYDQTGTGSVLRADLLIDYGPNRNNNTNILRTVVEGKSSLDAARSSATQFQRAYDNVTPRVLIVTPQGIQTHSPRMRR